MVVQPNPGKFVDSPSKQPRSIRKNDENCESFVSPKLQRTQAEDNSDNHIGSEIILDPLSSKENLKEFKVLDLQNDDKSNIELNSVRTFEIANCSDNFNLPELKSEPPSSPVDAKHKFEWPNESDVNIAPASVESEKDSTKSNSDCVVRDVPLNIYVGQVLIVRYSKHTYWPAVVYEFDESAVRVIFLAFGMKTGVVRKNRVLEFNGIESFLHDQKVDKSHKSNAKWKRACSTSKVWYRALVQAKFILSIEVDMRLALVNMIHMGSLPNALKKSTDLSEMIAQHSSPLQLKTVQYLFKENQKILNDIKQKLKEIASTFVSGVNIAGKRRKSVHKVTKRPKSGKFKPIDTKWRRRSPRLRTANNQTITNHLESLESFQTSDIVCSRKRKRSFHKDNGQYAKRMKFEKDLEMYAVTARQTELLFEDKRGGHVCKICLCEHDVEVVRCSGTCCDYVHKTCVDSTINGSEIVKCPQCVDSSSTICYVCKKANSETVLRCSKQKCHRYYHSSCLRDWPQTKFYGDNKFICPSHVCHTCMSNDPRNQHCPMVDSELTHCVKCLTTFHTDSTCIPAGVTILTINQHICLRHRTNLRKPVNVNWCYLCGGEGGTLFCCESCPLASHTSCVNTSKVGDRFFCGGCEAGRHPLYGEIVWVKYCNFRFWPAIVVPPPHIPINVLQHKIRDEHDICVRFFGDYTFGWVGRSFLYLYEEGDGSENFSDEWQALKEAEKCYWNLKVREKKPSNLQPLPYTKIKKVVKVDPAQFNKADVEPYRCRCEPTDPDPCGPSSCCTNREICVECDEETCPARGKCRNQCIARGTYANVRRKHMGLKGFGLIADEFIIKGTMVIEYVGELINEAEFQRRMAVKQTQNLYFMKYGKGQYIDAERKGNMARFINHSCNPNLKPQVWVVNGFECIAFVATEDISKNTELTCNYGFDDSTHECCCGATNCRKIIG